MGCSSCQSIQQQVYEGRPGKDGKSAYQLAVELGYTGSEEEWVNSLHGEAGRSAYEVWLSQGNTGTVQDFLDSLKGTPGTDGVDGVDGQPAYCYMSPFLNSFTMPFPGNTMSIPVTNASWMAIGEWVYVQNAGSFIVAGIAGNSVTFRNPGATDSPDWSGGLAGNAVPGSVIPAGGGIMVTPSGPPGKNGLNGTSTPGPPGPDGAPGMPGTQFFFVNGDPGSQAPSFGAPNGSIAVDTGDPTRMRYFRRVGPGSWDLVYEFATGTGGGGDVTGPAGTLDGVFAAFNGTTGKSIKPLDANLASDLLDTASDPFVRTSNIPSGGGDVTGPLSSVDGAFAVFDGATGKKIKQGPALGNAATRNVGTTAGTVAAGDDPRIVNAGDVKGPASAVTADRPAVFNGTTGKLLKQGPALFNGAYGSLTGVPSTFNPSNHAAKHKSGGTDPIALNELAAPTADVALNSKKITDLADATGAKEAVNNDRMAAYAVTGPGTAADNSFAVFDGATGKKIKQGPALGNAATRNVGTTAGTVAAGDDPRFAGLPADQGPWLKPYATKTGVGHYDLEEVYGVNSGNGALKLSQLYSQSDAAAKFDKLFQWYTAAGWTTAQVMQVRHFCAAHMEAVLQGHGQSNWGTGRIDSRNDVTWPRGVFPVNLKLIFDAGQYIGKGTTNSYVGGGGTVLVRDPAGWLEDAANQTLLHSSVYGAWSGLGYMEGGLIDNVRLEGLCDEKVHDNSFESHGIYIQGAGEVFRLGRVKANGFNGLGIKSAGGTPMECEHLSLFSNTLGGFGIYGGDLSTNYFGVVSADDNPCIFKIRESANGRAGGAMHVGLVKSESGKRTPNRGQIIMEADGFSGPNNDEGAYVNAHFGAIQADMNEQAFDDARTHAMFVVRGFGSNLPGGYTGARNARISVGAIRNWRSDYFLHCLGTKRAWPVQADYQQSGFVWNGSEADPDKNFWRPVVDGAAPTPDSVPSATRRLGIKRTGQANWGVVGMYDETFGTTNPPDPAPTGSTEQVSVGVLPSVITTGQTAQIHTVGLKGGYRIGTFTEAYYVVSGPATVNGSGVVTPTGTGIVRLRAVVGDAQQDCFLKVE